MKKGFTLIELLAVIVILAIILVVAVPRIMKAVDSSKVNAFISNEKLVLKSAELYVSKNLGILPSNIGDTSEILLSDLVTNGYIKDIKSPINKNNSCSGYVLITKKNSDEYDYTPHINCLDNTIVSSTQDKLSLHYKFDDFQEPTQNLFANRNMMTWGFDASGYSKTGTKVLQQDGSILIENVDSNSRFAISTTISALTDYTVSVKYKKIAGTPAFRWQILCQNGGPNLLQLWTQGLQNYVQDIDGWQNLSFTFNCPSPTTTARIFFQTGADYTAYNNTFFFKDPQLEKKSYATPFVDGIRNGTVIDYSINNNNASVLQDTTLKSDTEEAYLFNGIDSQITLNNFSNNLTDGITFGVWFKNSKQDTLIDRARLINKKALWNSPDGYAIQLHTTGRVYILGSNSNEVLSRVIPSWDDKLHNLYVTISPTNEVKIYFDGEQKAIESGSISTPIENSTALYIGGSLGRFFEGSIYDLQIYNRVLSFDEINLLYNSTK